MNVLLRLRHYTFGLFAVLAFVVLIAQAIAEEKKEKKKFNVIKLDKITVPVLQDGEVMSYYSFILDIGLKDDSKYEVALKNSPVIIDSIVSDLYTSLHLVWRPEIGDDLTIIKERLLIAANKSLGKGVIGNIILNSAKKVKESEIDRRKRYKYRYR